MISKYNDNQAVLHKVDKEEERFLCEQLVWIKKRMDVLTTIEEKLKQIRTLALYVVEHKLNEQEVGQVQLEVDDLLREIMLLSQDNEVYH
jgi:hypothetical protein